ncbi:hypothetical protein CY34DRAFT_14572 [Suillus luteus UH-Slu-Lm8-n1]|uniref:Unplaced genomic scaffold CY34scaffold_225, whole genome shotgun sequence n=1 Tax=Suillus luteus UH-Slu-Lm8-n1 TaxID=930992 RepID=A0A0D0AXN9_9AGAM|nr:hypothetical protein CY34DRAFT_14572 [Suillus luteus UH-Slu-Lm8-n1]
MDHHNQPDSFDGRFLPWDPSEQSTDGAQPQPQAMGSGSYPNSDSFTADLIQPNFNESDLSVPRPHAHASRDEFHYLPYDPNFAANAYTNLNVANGPYYYGRDDGGGQQQPALQAQTPGAIQNPPNLSLWPVYRDAQGQVGSSSHNYPPPAVEAPFHAFDAVSRDPVDQKINRGRRKVGLHHSYHAAASSRPKRASDARSLPQPQADAIPDSLRVIQVFILPPQLIEKVKEVAYGNMVKLTFEGYFWLADEGVKDLANRALDAAVARYPSAELNKWRKRVEAKGEIIRLKGVPATILNAFQACGRLVVFVAYELAFPLVAQHRKTMESDRVDQVDSLLLHEAYLDGFLDLRAEDGSIQPFLVPFANRAITNMLEIVLSEHQLGQYLFDDSDNWRLRLSNAFFLGGTTCRWGLSQYRTGVFVGAELDTPENAQHFKYLADHVSRFDPTKRSLFDALLDEEYCCPVISQFLWI